MNRKEANLLMGRFWSGLPVSVMLDESIYMIDFFIEWLWKEGYEITMREFDGVRQGN